VITWRGVVPTIVLFSHLAAATCGGNLRDSSLSEARGGERPFLAQQPAVARFELAGM